MEGSQVTAEFYALLDDMRKTFSIGIDRVSDKLDEVKSNMATHREVDELKQRTARLESSIELMRQDTVKREELRDEIRSLRGDYRELSDRYTKIETRQGKLPGWLWSAIISAIMSIATIFFLHGKPG